MRNYNPSPLGCWAALDYPGYAIENCGGPTVPLPQANVYPFPYLVAQSRGGYTFGSPIPKFPRTTYKPSATPTSFKPTAKPSVSPSVPSTATPSIAPTAQPSSVTTKALTTAPTAPSSSLLLTALRTSAPSASPTMISICQWSGYCRSSADCVAGNKCTTSNLPYYSQCIPDAST